MDKPTYCQLCHKECPQWQELGTVCTECEFPFCSTCFIKTGKRTRQRTLQYPLKWRCDRCFERNKN